MLRRLLTVCILISFVATEMLNAQYRAFPIDDGHSSITFSTYFTKIIKVPGSFGNYWGHVFYDPQDITKLSASIIIDVSTINTNGNFRDAHLKRADFFDVENHPYITFSSEKVLETEDGYALSGTIQIKGQVKQIQIPFQIIDTLNPDPWGNERFTLAGNFQLNRNDFGIGEEGEFFHRSINEMIDVELVMTMAIRNTDRYSLFNHPFGKAIYELMLKEGTAAGLEYFEANKDEQEQKFVHSSQFLDMFAQRLIQYKEFDKAIAVYQYNQELFPDEDFTYANLANAYFMNKKKKKAQTFAKKALEKNEFNTLGLELNRLLAK
ncbi:MAG: YceI family protein [Saprospiraceae bacterium]|nr:YceI family protein [Saprospiraceae bacterium]